MQKYARSAEINVVRNKRIIRKKGAGMALIVEILLILVRITFT